MTNIPGLNITLGEPWFIHCARAGSSRHTLPPVELLSNFWSQEECKKAYSLKTWDKGMTVSDSKQEIVYPSLNGGYRSLFSGSEPTTFFLACQYDIREVDENYLSPAGIPMTQSLALEQDWHMLAWVIIWTSHLISFAMG